MCDNLTDQHTNSPKINYNCNVCVLATIACSGNQANFSKLIIDQASNSIIDSELISAKLPIQLSILNRFFSFKLNLIIQFT